jgi:hypothetical protein
MMNKARRGKIVEKVSFNDNKVFCIAERAKDFYEQGLWLAKKFIKINKIAIKKCI